VCRFGVRERSSLASDNNVTCTVAENVTNKQEKRPGNSVGCAEEKDPNQTFAAD
jgi:hypothetical protein